MSDTDILPNPPTAMLRAVHEKLRELFARYNALVPEKEWARKGLFHVIQEVLLTHMEIEETLFYPAVQRMKTELAIKVVLRALKDHQEMKTLLVELKTLCSEGKPLHPRMEELEQCVFAHFRLEEGEVFVHARSMPPETLLNLSSEMEELRELIRKNRRALEQSQGEDGSFLG